MKRSVTSIEQYNNKTMLLPNQNEEFRRNSTKAIKEWTRQYFKLDEEATVLVAELNCAEPNCPDKETVITVFHDNGNTEKHSIKKPLLYVRKWDIMGLAQPSQKE